MADSLTRFIFEDYDIRGELVRLKDSSQVLLENHGYPDLLAGLLQEAAAINVLLATTLKFEGKLTLQLQTQGKLTLLVVQTTHELNYRGICRYDTEADFSAENFSSLTKGGQLFITIEPTKGNRYQGIVPIEKDSLTECIEQYFMLSEQLKTRLWLFREPEEIRALFIQALPDMKNPDDFEHLEHLSSTLGHEESFAIDDETLLHRLFHQENLSHIHSQPVNFQCDCSREKMLSSVSLLAQDELEQILEQNHEHLLKRNYQ